MVCPLPKICFVQTSDLVQELYAPNLRVSGTPVWGGPEAESRYQLQQEAKLRKQRNRLHPTQRGT
jgi:hypothetical protein